LIDFEPVKYEQDLRTGVNLGALTTAWARQFWICWSLFNCWILQLDCRKTRHMAEVLISHGSA